MTKGMYNDEPAVGDVYQINEKHGRIGWIGAFVLVTEVRDWGIQGFVHMIQEHESPPGFAYIRLTWSEITYIGPATLIPAQPEEEDAQTRSQR